MIRLVVETHMASKTPARTTFKITPLGERGEVTIYGPHSLKATHKRWLIESPVPLKVEAVRVSNSGIITRQEFIVDRNMMISCFLRVLEFDEEIADALKLRIDSYIDLSDPSHEKVIELP